jgi:hypothetical protein
VERFFSDLMLKVSFEQSHAIADDAETETFQKPAKGQKSLFEKEEKVFESEVAEVPRME